MFLAISACWIVIANPFKIASRLVGKVRMMVLLKAYSSSCGSRSSAIDRAPSTGMNSTTPSTTWPRALSLPASSFLLSRSMWLRTFLRCSVSAASRWA